MNLSDRVSKQARSHGKIVGEILPRFAEKLKKESVISAYDRHPFKIPFVESWPSIKIIPDLVIHLPNGEKVLVEIANPKDPKRFVGEIVYPQILGYYKEIVAAIVFVLHPQKRKVHTRSMIQRMALAQFLRKQIPSVVASWPANEDVAYRNLKLLLTREIDWLSSQPP